MRHLAASLALVITAPALSFAPIAGTVSQNPSPTGLVLGRVVDAESNSPIAGVLVTLGQTPSPFADRRDTPKQVITDPQGRFVFRELPKGNYRLTASISGNGYSPSGFLISGLGQPIGPYLSGGYGQLRPDGPMLPIELGENARISDAVIRLWKGGAIDGIVVDEAGEPVVGQYVAAVRRSTDGRLLTGPTQRTDDRGQYHLGTLSPGDYVVVVPQIQMLSPLDVVPESGSDPMLVRAMNTGGRPNTVGILAGSSKLASGKMASGDTMGTGPINTLEPRIQSGALSVYQTTFHPAALTASQATIIKLKPGEERVDIVVALHPTRAGEISGVLTDDMGPVSNFGLHLMPTDDGDGSSVLEVATTVTNPSGAFVFPLVPSGSYVIRALRPPRPPAPPGQTPLVAKSTADRVGAWATVPVSIAGQNVTGVSVVLRPGVRVAGHLRFQGTAAPPTPDRLRQVMVTLAPAQELFRSAPRSPSAPLDTANFTIDGVSPGRYVFRIPDIAPGWTLESISAAGRDVTDAAIPVDAEVSEVEVVFTDRAAGVSGTVRDPATALPDGTASVVVFPADRQRWRDARASTRTFVIARTNASGAFTIANVPPGNYLVAALPDRVAGDWPDQKFLEKLAPLASSLRVASGQSQTVTLNTVVIR